MRFIKLVILYILHCTVLSASLAVHVPLPTYLHSPSIDSRFTYDGFLEVIDAIENGRLEACANFQELEHVKEWVVTIARQGAGEENLSILEADIVDLLSPNENYEFAFGYECDYVYMNEDGQLMTCSWVSKRWKHVRKFVKKHKKALIIGAVAIAATATVIGYIAAAPAVAAAVGASTSKSEKSHAHAAAPESGNTPTTSPDVPEYPRLEQIFAEQQTAFKEILKKEDFLPNSSIAIWDDLGRAVDTNLARSNYYALLHRISSDPEIMSDIHRMNSDNVLNRNNLHRSLAEEYGVAEPEYHFETAVYQACGEVALAHDLPKEAVYNFNRAIDKSPTNASLYLERGKIHFDNGNYDESLKDFQQFRIHKLPSNNSSLSEMTVHFTRGLTRGTAHSSSQLCLLVADLVRHPIETTSQLYEGFKILAVLSMTAEWDSLAEALVPEARELAKNWHQLTDEGKCELAGYILGKHGTDILLPGAAAKAISRGVKGAREFASACRHIRTAEKTLALESVAGVQGGANSLEILTNQKKTLELGESLGFSTEEMAGLKQSGALEAVIAEVDATVYNSPAFLASKTHFDMAQAFLKKFNGYKSETEIRGLIHQTGMPTFPRPTGIPENYRVKLSDKGAGMKYVHPTNEQISIRVMPGKPHSHNPAQRQPYVIDSRDHFCYDRVGNKVSNRDVSAHIPLEEYVYRE